MDQVIVKEGAGHYCHAVAGKEKRKLLKRLIVLLTFMTTQSKE